MVAEDGNDMKKISVDKAAEIARALLQYDDEDLKFIHLITSTPHKAREWKTAETRLAHMVDVRDTLGSISWEAKDDEISSLCSEAEIRIEDLKEDVNEHREELGIQLEEL